MFLKSFFFIWVRVKIIGITTKSLNVKNKYTKKLTKNCFIVSLTYLN